MDADETLCDQRWCLAASTHFACSDEGLIVVAVGRRFRLNFGSRELEQLVVDGLRAQTLVSALGAFSKKAVGGAIRALRDVGAIVASHRTFPINLLQRAGDDLATVNIADAELVVLVTHAFDPRAGVMLERVRKNSVPCLLAWTAGSSIAFAYDDGAHRPCVGCALLFDTACLTTTLTEPAVTIADVASAVASQMASPGGELPPAGSALVLETKPWRFTWEPFQSHPSCPCRARGKTKSGDGPPPLQEHARFAPLLIVKRSGENATSAKMLYRRDQQPGRQAKPSVGVATAAGPDANIRALAEGVERFCMLHAPPSISAAKASDLTSPVLADAVIRSLLFRDEELAKPGFRFSAYTPDVALDWTPAKDALTSESVLVPLTLVGRPPSDQVRLVDPTSNGYAAHTDRDRAAQLALLEVIERDAVMMSWYLDLRLPLLDLSVTELSGGAAGLTRAIALLATQDIDIPVVWILGLLEDGSLYSASGAALSFSEAVRRARAELLAALQRSRSPRPTTPPRLADVTQKHGPLDHLTYWRDSTRAAALVERKLSASAQSRARCDDCSRRWPEDRERGGATQVASILSRAGLKAYLVDRALPEVFGDGWAVVRALVPGAVELSWGKGYRRLASERLADRLRQGFTLIDEPHPVA